MSTLCFFVHFYHVSKFTIYYTTFTYTNSRSFKLLRISEKKQILTVSKFDGVPVTVFWCVSGIFWRFLLTHFPWASPTTTVGKLTFVYSGKYNIALFTPLFHNCFCTFNPFFFYSGRVPQNSSE